MKKSDYIKKVVAAYKINPKRVLSAFSCISERDPEEETELQFIKRAAELDYLDPKDSWAIRDEEDFKNLVKKETEF